MAMLLQNFDFRLDDPSYNLKIKSNLTVKPDGFYMRSSLRKGISASALQERLSSTSGEVKSSTAVQQATSRLDELKVDDTSNREITILYGSNTGTCQAFAQKLAADARAHGFHANVMDMDSGVNALPTNQPVVVITASYEGLPPDNATHFVAWLESMREGNALTGVEYAVFGCGHKDWSSTFHRIPKLVDETLEKLGATRLVERGSSDASQGDMFTDFDTWEESKLWPALKMKLGAGEVITKPTKQSVEMEISTNTRASQLQHDVQHGKVLAAKCLTAPGEPEKRHLEIKLPEGMEYEAGDYLAVLPLNPDESVHRVLNKFSLPWDAVITIKEGGPVTLPANMPVSAFDLLKGFVEISLPATRKACPIVLRPFLNANPATRTSGNVWVTRQMIGPSRRSMRSPVPYTKPR